MDSIFSKSGKTKDYADIIIALVVVLVIGLIIIPLPAALLDFLIITNITIAVNILLLTLFTKNVLEFATFPTLLLITTMFRLGLNISSTRLVLTQGSAGQVIDAFANVVAGNNYIVGAVIFIIITIIQIIVVSNGASRVAEVSARFTLDAMPGKQMAIDADLNSGLVTEEQAKQRRKDLQREANFYGSMDGASKFVKGDAVAGIIIVLVNLVGGILIYGVGNDLPVLEALQKFGKLSIGDGLVSQIPSLLISVASGIIVTRSDDDHSFGKAISADFIRNPKIAMIVAIVLVALGLVPGFPKIPFFIMAIGLGILSYTLTKKESAREQSRKAREQVRNLQNAGTDHEEDILSFQVEPISLEIGYALISLTDEKMDNSLMSKIIAIRKQCAIELGILLTPIRIRDNLQLQPNDYSIKIKGNIVARGELYPNKFMIIEPDGDDFEGIPTIEPAFGLDALWVEERNRELADLKGYTLIEPVTVIATHLKEVIYHHSAELLGRQEVKKLLENIKEKYNVVIDELIPDILSLGAVQKVLQNLLREQIPINDLVTILETLADHGTTTKDTELLTEYVRQALQRTVTKPFIDEENLLKVVTIHPDIENLLSESIQKSANGSIPVLKPETTTRIFDRVKQVNERLIAENVTYVILTSPKIRIAFHKLISYNFPDLAVLSLNEVPIDVGIETVGMIAFSD